MDKNKRLQNEIKKLKQELAEYGDPEKHFQACRWSVDLQDNIFVWNGYLLGPVGTPYENQIYEVQLNVTNIDYPNDPPTAKFTKAIPFHANVYTNGSICIDILKRGDQGGSWTPVYQFRNILLSLVSMLNEPNTSSPANSTASKAYDNDLTKNKIHFSRMAAEHYANQSHLIEQRQYN